MVSRWGGLATLVTKMKRCECLVLKTRRRDGAMRLLGRGGGYLRPAHHTHLSPFLVSILITCTVYMFQRLRYEIAHP